MNILKTSNSADSSCRILNNIYMLSLQRDGYVRCSLVAYTNRAIHFLAYNDGEYIAHHIIQTNKWLTIDACFGVDDVVAGVNDEYSHFQRIRANNEHSISADVYAKYNEIKAK